MVSRASRGISAGASGPAVPDAPLADALPAKPFCWGGVKSVSLMVSTFGHQPDIFRCKIFFTIDRYSTGLTAAWLSDTHIEMWSAESSRAYRVMGLASVNVEAARACRDSCSIGEVPDGGTGMLPGLPDMCRMRRNVAETACNGTVTVSKRGSDDRRRNT